MKDNSAFCREDGNTDKAACTGAGESSCLSSINLEKDPLTGLLNRASTEAHISFLLRKYPEQNHALLLVDIDNLKLINDKNGHEAGDQMVKTAASVLSRHFGANAVIGRIGGDEFAVLMMNVRSGDVVRSAAHGLSEALKRSEATLDASFSVGYILSDGAPTVYEVLLRQASEALYEAKRHGGGWASHYGSYAEPVERQFVKDGRMNILIVDDNVTNRKILNKNLSQDYNVIEAANGVEALTALRKNPSHVDGIVLDLIMPIMDGFEFLAEVQKNDDYRKIPIIVATGNEQPEHEARVLQLGAWDFVTKPYNMQVLKFRLHNAILRSQLSALNKLKYLAEYDTLTGIYNKRKFFELTRDMLLTNRDKKFVFIRFDIENFKLVNSFFGSAEGDRLLRAIADGFRKYATQNELMTYGHIQADVFCACIPYTTRGECTDGLEKTKERITQLFGSFRIVPVFGLYVISDPEMSVDMIYDNAIVAARECKGNYLRNYAFYEEKMREKIEKETELASEMSQALEDGQFVVYYQPKYDVKSSLPHGAEALVRWKHPVKGMISPGEFIPLFEKNGFIMQVDYFVWEQVCKLLKRRRQDGSVEFPISVNVSRVNLYNPKLIDDLVALVHKYDIPASLLNLEITESAYTENPHAMQEMVTRLQKEGFVIMMDDFGSGYSSLNVLKDLNVNVLKIDMNFLPDKLSGRAELILASVIRMAKWLDTPVVAEGVETHEQALFLKNIGCDYIQGYFYARPMAQDDFERHMEQRLAFAPVRQQTPTQPLDGGSVWFNSPKAAEVFEAQGAPVAVYSYTSSGDVELLRANEVFLFKFSYDERHQSDVKKYVDAGQLAIIKETFERSLVQRGDATCEYMRVDGMRRPAWIEASVKYCGQIDGKNILSAVFSDVTDAKKAQLELDKLRSLEAPAMHSLPYMLIADDVAVDRAILREMFSDRFRIMEAADGEQALKVMREYGAEIAVLLLDLVMPIMSGQELLKIRNDDTELVRIPTIVISSDGSQDSQIHMLELGVNDYITKPFVPEAVLRRVCNVLECDGHFREMVAEYHRMKHAKASKNTTNAKK